MYEACLSHTLKTLQDLPTPIPESGSIAGIVMDYIAPNGEMFHGDNLHFPMGTAYLTLGVPGVARKAAETAAKTDDPLKKELLEGISQVYEAVARYFARYAQAVFTAAGEDPRLLAVARSLDTLSKGAPVHFRDAIQLVYLMWKLRVAHSGWFGADIGRLDYYLRPWFEKDIASGDTDEEQVLALILDFWHLLNVKRSGDTLINVMLGGSSADGSDDSSRLSVLMLKATMLCGQSEPHVSVRIHPGIRRDVYDAMLRVQLMGQGQATVYNDAVVIPSMVRFGIPREIACHYGNDGCTEILLDGFSGITFNRMDAVAVFELAFNNGRMAEKNYTQPMRYWNKNDIPIFYTPEAIPGFASGETEACETFEEFYQCFLRQYRYQTLEKARQLRELDAENRRSAYTSLLLNGTFDQVLESGKDISRDAFDYPVYMIFSGSIPTVADCLMGVKTLVYDKKWYTISQIKEAILANFEGYEVMRSRMLAAPKFGNDLDGVDNLAADIAQHYCSWLEEFRAETGFAVMPSLIGYTFLYEAYGVAATPDGRKYGDPIAEHFCATPGRAEKGPTALINSICKSKAAIAKACGAASVHVSLPRNLGNSDEESLMILDSLVSAAAEGGMNEMNIAIYDTELLRQAQKDPENHRDIVVRVWGYCARFVDLCKEMQDHIIHRVTTGG